MYSLKGKVAEKVSRLFADSHSSGPSATPIDPLPNPPQEESHTEGGKSLSSFFSHISFDALKSIPCPHNVIPIQSLRVRWRSAESEHPDEPSDSCTDVQEEEEEHSSRRSTSSSETFEDAISPTKLEKEMPKNLADESAFISSELYEFLQSCLPNIVKGCQWVLLYSTLKHGTSLRMLIRKSADVSGHCLLIVGDMQGAVFGGLLECPLKPTAKRRYQGTNQTFVFTTIYGEPRLFRPTGANRYFCMCLNDLLALGGGGNFALRLNEDLLSGTSGPCETFGNRCLAHNSEFELKNVELWGFTHSSRYYA